MRSYWLARIDSWLKQLDRTACFNPKSVPNCLVHLDDATKELLLEL